MKTKRTKKQWQKEICKAGKAVLKMIMPQNGEDWIPKDHAYMRLRTAIKALEKYK